MGTTTMTFSREAGNYTTYVTQEVGDDLGFETTQAPSFPSDVKATSIAFYIAKGLKSGSGNSRSCKIGVDFKCNSSWCSVWSGYKTLSGDGGDGTIPEFDITIPTQYQRSFAQYGISKVRITQDDDYAIKGTSTAHGTAVFTYETLPTHVSPPSDVKVAKSFSAVDVDLTWKAGHAGTQNSVSGYDVQYADSADGSAWGDWNTAAGSPTIRTVLSVSPPNSNGHYRKFRVRTRGSAGSEYYSEFVESTNTLRKAHEALEGFTDSPLSAGMPVKALHMTELHDRVNTLRAFYDLSDYTFSLIDARGIAGWTDHVKEIRTAIDEVYLVADESHDAWIAFSVNCPRADVIEQLRTVVLAL